MLHVGSTGSVISVHEVVRRGEDDAGIVYFRKMRADVLFGPVAHCMWQGSALSLYPNPKLSRVMKR